MPTYYDNIQDRAGNAVTSAEVTVLITSSGIPADLFEDDGTTPLANPLLNSTDYYNSLGQIRFTVADGEYTIRVVDGGQTRFMGPISIRSAGSPAAGASGAVQFSNGAGVLIADDSTFHWDNALKRLGIGTDTPDVLLELRSAVAAYLRLRNTGSDYARVELQRDAAVADEIVATITAQEDGVPLGTIRFEKDSVNEAQIVIEDSSATGGITLTVNPLGTYGFDIVLNGDVDVQGELQAQDSVFLNANSIIMDAGSIESLLQVGYNGNNVSSPLGSNILSVTSDITVLTLTGNQAISSIIGRVGGTHHNFILIVEQDGTGGYDITSWPAAVSWPGAQAAPVMPSGPNEYQAILFVYDGTTYFANPLSDGTGGGGGITNDVSYSDGVPISDPYLDYTVINAGTSTISLAIDEIIYFPYFLPVTGNFDGYQLFFMAGTPSDQYEMGLYKFNSSSGDMELVISGFASTSGASAFPGSFTDTQLEAGGYVMALMRVGQGFPAVTAMRCSPAAHGVMSIYNLGSPSRLSTAVTSLPASWTPSGSNPLPASSNRSVIPFIPLKYT